MQTKLRSDAFLQQAMDTCGDAVYRLALCRLNSRADAEAGRHRFPRHRAPESMAAARNAQPVRRSSPLGVV